MKPLAEMNDKEKAEFKAMAEAIYKETRTLDVPTHERPAMLCLWIKTWGRKPVNLRTEYEIDRNLFVDDAITQAAQYVANMAAAVEQRNREAGRELISPSLAAQVQRAAIDTLHHANYRPVVDRVFVGFFRHLKSMG